MDITYLSSPSGTNMADQWFEIADLDHFWVRRRFQVFRTLMDPLGVRPRIVGEVGCGHGLVQHQFHSAYGVDVLGFDLNANGLRASCAQHQPRYYYNVFDRNGSFKQHFDLIFLFDVIEHIEDEDAFMAAVLFHLKPGGMIAINVPALQSMWSVYDETVGHVRRYTVDSLRTLADRTTLTMKAISYWGMPLLPLLMARKARLAMSTEADAIVNTGFRPPSARANRLLSGLAALESIPQTVAGTSVMGLFQLAPGGREVAP